jgi:spore maturation protein CgeB
MIAKYFEIIASGTLLIANTIPELKMAGFEPNVNYVELDWNCSKNDIIELVEYYLNNDEEREMIIKNALELSKNHTPEIRAKQIGEALWQ